jgi:hypothetical protein
MTRLGELGTTQAATSIQRTLRRNIPEDTILHSHRRENLKSYTLTTVCKKLIIPCLPGESHVRIMFGLQHKNNLLKL